MPIFTLDEGDPTRNMDNRDEENGVKLDYSTRVVSKINETLRRLKHQNLKGQRVAHEDDFNYYFKGPMEVYVRNNEKHLAIDKVEELFSEESDDDPEMEESDSSSGLSEDGAAEIYKPQIHFTLNDMEIMMRNHVKSEINQQLNRGLTIADIKREHKHLHKRNEELAKMAYD